MIPNKCGHINIIIISNITSHHINDAYKRHALQLTLMRCDPIVHNHSHPMSTDARQLTYRIWHGMT